MNDTAKKQREAEYQKYIVSVALLDSIAYAKMSRAGFDVSPSGSVRADDFEEAKEQCEVIFASTPGRTDEKEMAIFADKLWAFREHKFDTMSESCVD